MKTPAAAKEHAEERAYGEAQDRRCREADVPAGPALGLVYEDLSRCFRWLAGRVKTCQESKSRPWPWGRPLSKALARYGWETTK
jgi:hypothetical protein